MCHHEREKDTTYEFFRAERHTTQVKRSQTCRQLDTGEVGSGGVGLGEEKMKIRFTSIVLVKGVPRNFVHFTWMRMGGRGKGEKREKGEEGKGEEGKEE